MLMEAPERLGDRVYEHLREMVLSGELEAGDRLSVPNLALRFAVSRSPIREAVQRLIQDGLAVDEPRRGATVTSVSSEHLAGLFEIREALEGLAARLAAKRASNDQIEKLKAALEAHQVAVAANEQELRQSENLRFHRIIHQAASNVDLLRQLENLDAKVRLAIRRTGAIKGDMEETIDEHRQIFQAIMARDPDAAETAARKHIGRVREKLLQL